MADPNIGEIVATTLRNRSKKLADNVSNGNVILKKLASREGGIRTAASGRTIVEELEYAENGTFMYYNGAEVLDITPSRVVDAAEFNWKQAAVAVTANGLETRIQNAGDAATIDLLESRIRNAEKTMRNQIALGVYSDGTGTNGKQIGGLAALVPTTTGSTVGGISATTYTFWEVGHQNTSADWSTGTINDVLVNAWLATVRGSDHINLFIMGASAYRKYWESLLPIQRITSPESGAQGYSNLSFYGPGGSAEVAFEDSGTLATTLAYGLNTDYIHYRPHVSTNMVPLDRRESINQDAFVSLIIWAGNMTVSNRSLQAVISGTAD